MVSYVPSSHQCMQYWCFYNNCMLLFLVICKQNHVGLWGSLYKWFLGLDLDSQNQTKNASVILLFFFWT